VRTKRTTSVYEEEKESGGGALLYRQQTHPRSGLEIYSGFILRSLQTVAVFSFLSLLSTSKSEKL